MGILSNILAIKNRWESIHLEALGMDAIEQEEDKVIDFNKVQLREQGILPDGKPLKPYSRNTIKIKQAEGKEWRWTTLVDTGAFQAKMTILETGNEFTIDSPDAKTSEIIAKYGDVFGLTSEHKRKTWAEIVRPYTIAKIKELTGAR